jgi:hypothetical protein
LAFFAWSAWGIAFIAISVRVWFKPGSHSVFTIFRQAGAHWINAENLYGQGSGQGSKFLYSPLGAALFAPFSLLPENIAGIAWRLIGGSIMVTAAYVIARMVWVEPSKSWKRSIGLLALLPICVSNLNNGQTNPLVLALILFSVVSLLKRYWFLCVLCLGIATYFKIYPIALGLLLAVVFPRQLSWRLITAIIALFLLSLLLQHPSYVISQYADWVAHLGELHRRSADQFGRWRDAYFLLRMAHVPIASRFWVVVEVISGIGIAAFCVWGAYRGWHTDRLIFAAVGLGCVWMVLIGPASEASSYVLVGPVLIYGLLQSWTQPVSSPIRLGMTVAYSGLLLADICDSWLRLKAHSVYALSLQPIVALIFLATTFAWLIADKYWTRPEGPPEFAN